MILRIQDLENEDKITAEQYFINIITLCAFRLTLFVVTCLIEDLVMNSIVLYS